MAHNQHQLQYFNVKTLSLEYYAPVNSLIIMHFVIRCYQTENKMHLGGALVIVSFITRIDHRSFRDRRKYI